MHLIFSFNQLRTTASGYATNAKYFVTVALNITGMQNTSHILASNIYLEVLCFCFLLKFFAIVFFFLFALFSVHSIALPMRVYTVHISNFLLIDKSRPRNNPCFSSHTQLSRPSGMPRTFAAHCCCSPQSHTESAS